MFATELIDAKGKINKHYRQQDIMTPFDKLTTVLNAAPEPGTLLKPGITLKDLDAIAHAMTDNQATERLKHAKAQCSEPSTHDPDPPLNSTTTPTSIPFAQTHT